MPSYSVFKPNAKLYLAGSWDRTRVRELPERVGSYPLKEAVCDDIGAALLRQCVENDDIGKAYDRALESRLIDLEDLIDVGRIMDEWAEASTFDPARITTTEAAWAIIGRTNFAIVEAKLVDSSALPNGKDWEAHAYTYTRDGWTGKEALNLRTPGNVPLGEYAKGVADIARLFTDGPRDVVAANLENALQTKDVAAAGVARVMVEKELEDYIRAFCGNFLDETPSPEGFKISPLSWQACDSPVIPNIAKAILKRGAHLAMEPIIEKAGPYNVRVEASLGAEPFASAKITAAPEPGFDYEQTILESVKPIPPTRDGIAAAALDALRDVLDREGYTRFAGIEVNEGLSTKDFDVLLEETKLALAGATMKFPHPLDLEKLSESHFVFDGEDAFVTISNHGDEAWSATTICALQAPRTDYGSTFGEAYTNAYNAQRAELSLKTDARLCINNPDKPAGTFYTEAEQIDLRKAEREMRAAPVAKDLVEPYEITNSKNLISELVRPIPSPARGADKARPAR
jgi:hypothetical protein